MNGVCGVEMFLYEKEKKKWKCNENFWCWGVGGMDENNGEVDGVQLQPLLKMKLFGTLPLYIIFYSFLRIGIWEGDMWGPLGPDFCG